MKLSFFKKIFIESNLHGFQLIFKTSHHLIERLLWIALIVTSIYFVLETLIDEWYRYKTKSIALFLETNYKSWKFIAPASTICTDFIDPKRVDNLIEKSWEISKNDSKFVIYKKFIEVVTLTTYGNLHQYKQFLDYPFLDRLDMLQIAKEMREYLLPQAGYNAVITEMGICFSSTYLHSLQNVSERIVPTIGEEGDICSSSLSLESCRLNINAPIKFDTEDDFKQTLFIHNKDDVLNPFKTISLTFLYETVTDVELIINAIVASNKLNQLSPSQRKCLFQFELPLKYFKIYTTSLCMISCRINLAVKLCGCIPFFYRISKLSSFNGNIQIEIAFADSVENPVCNIQGMACLSNNLWFERVSNSSHFLSKCICLPLCNSYEYQRTTTKYETSSDYTSFMSASIRFPKTRIKRGVVYSADNLLVSFGGAFGLYLGGSFISIVEFAFLILEVLMEIFASVCKALKLTCFQ